MTIWVSSLLLFLAAATLLAYRGLGASTELFDSHRSRVELRADLEAWAEQAIRLLASDPTPFAHSPHDPVWRFLAALTGSNVESSLSDISMLPGASPFIDLESDPIPAIEEFLRDHEVGEEAVRRTADLLAVRRGAGRRTLASELRGALGASYAEMAPVLAGEPMANVNLAPRWVIGAALSRGCAPPDAARKLCTILALRQSQEIDDATLDRLLRGAGADRSLPIRLGVRTRVWRLKLSSGGTTLTKTLVHLGPSATGRLCVTEDRFATAVDHER